VFEGGDGDGDLGRCCAEGGEAWGEPELRDGGEGGDVDRPRGGGGAEVVDGLAEGVEGLRELREGLLAELGEADAARGAGEEGRAEGLFELLDVGGDRAGGDAEFLCGGGEAVQAGGGFEGAQRGEGEVLGAGWGDGHF